MQDFKHHRIPLENGRFNSGELDHKVNRLVFPLNTAWARNEAFQVGARRRKSGDQRWAKEKDGVLEWSCDRLSLAACRA